MPPTMAHGKICYLVIPARDVSASAAFYEGVFGWPMRTRGDGAIAFDDGVGQVSGTFATDREPDGDPGVLIYIMVEDIANTIDALRANGGEIVKPVDPDAREVTAHFRDPAGNVLGIYEERTLRGAR